MNDFLSRVEAILSGVMNFNPKSRVERLLMKWVGSIGNVEDLETDDKSSIVAAINEVNSSGGGGGLPDAPKDGKQYARQNGAWSEVESGGYEPPVGGIPKTDLASDAQASLGKADTSVQPADLSDYAKKSDLGELADLDTTDKSNIVAAINEVAASGGGKPYHAGTNPPTNTNIFWVDTSDDVTVSITDGLLSFIGVDPVETVTLVGTNLIFD